MVVPRLATHRRIATLLTVAALSLTACDDTDAPQDTADAVMDVANETDTGVNPCDCPDGVCADGTCNVRVVLLDTCRGVIDEANVTVDGQMLGVATPDAELVSCQTWACDGSVTMEVRSTGFSTGERVLGVALDPEVELDCL